MATIEYGKYTTVSGDMWDGISYKLYGTMNRAAEIAELNEKYIDCPTLPGGIELRTPPEKTAPPANAGSLPAWKRA